MKNRTIFVIYILLSLLGKQNLVAQTDTFYYTGYMQTFTVPTCMFSLTIDCYGAQGIGVANEKHPGYGGEARGVLSVIPGQTYYVFVGGQANWNGGGLGQMGANGGDASDVRYPGTSLSDRVIVAGGGGGSGGDNWQCVSGVHGDGGGGIAVGTNFVGGGGGLGYTYSTGCGTNGSSAGGSGGTGCHGGGGGGGGLYTGGQGAEATCGPFYADSGEFGQGGNAYNAPLCARDLEGAGGGGGGYYGGGGSVGYNCGAGEGGGGSSWTGTLTSPYFNSGSWTGNGMIIITYGIGILPISFSQTNPTCGFCDGSLKATVNGGGTPYTYSWSPGGQTADSISGLCAGTYDLTVSDTCGNTASASVVLPANPLPISTIVIKTPKCNGNCIGSAKTTVIKGTSPYTYSWAPSGGTKDTATGLCAAVYTITVTDKNGCTGSATATITQPADISGTDTVTNVACYGGTGKATISPAGGNSPYTYSWAPGGQTTATVTSLSAGSYAIKINDINGCTGSVSVIVTQPALLTATMGAPGNIACYGNSANVSVNASGGTSPYTYTWTPSGQTTATATGLTAGGYRVTITDNNDCSVTAGVTITQPSLLTATMGVPNNVPCNGGVGNATVTAGGGVSPYLYSWSPSGGSNAQGTGLSAGSYSVTITDRNSCMATASVIITQPALLTVNKDTILNPLCNVGVGSASVHVSGGTSAYTYLWTPSKQSTDSATALSAGSYTVSVTDTHHCSATVSVILTQPTPLTTTVSQVNVLCNGGTGSATVNASGSVSPYTYLWTPSNQSTATATGLSAASYIIKVSDTHGCTATNTITITQPAVLTATMGSPNNIKCYGGTGSVTVTAGGGTIPYTYLWTPSSESTANATGLFVGSYTVTVTDAHHCTASATVTMTQPTVVAANITSSKDISCMNGSDGSATITGSGGTTPYTYVWNPSGQSNATATGLFALSYTATVTDNNGCTATASINLTEPMQVTAAISEPKIICKDSTGILIANASGGTPPYQYNWSSGATTGIATITPIATNMYSVMVTDSHGCTASATIALQYGPAFAVDITGKRNVCVGDSTTICATAIGAIDGVFYEWAPTNNTNGCIEISPTLTNVYTVTVIDGCGSTTTAQTSISSEPSPVIDFGVNFSQGCEPFCVQFNNNTTLTKGQVGEYIWDFGNGDSSKSKSPIYCYKTAGQYNISLTVISDSGCSATLKKINMLSIYAPPKAAFTYSPQPVSILSPTVQFQDKSTDPNGNNGRIIYWIWDFGDRSDSSSNIENPIHTYQDTGTYCINLSVMSKEGCTDTTTNCLIVEPDFTLYIPSAFTPNGDGLNETFKPVGQYVKTFEMYIFNRWGEQIFHTTDLTNGWNGGVNGTGQLSPEDVYIYKIMVTDAENHTHSYMGNVTLLK